MSLEKLNIDKSEWVLTPLGALATEISKRVDNPAESEFDRFVGLEHFVSGNLKIKKWGTTENLTSSAKAFQKGDILFARRNAYLRRASLADFEGCCSGDAFVLRENHDKVLPGFLAFIVNSDALWNYANANAAGTMSKRVKWRDLANYEILLPPMEQQAILGQLLWSMDEVIDKELNTLDKIVTFKESISKEQLMGSNLIGPKKIEQKFGEIPDDWNLISIEEVALKITDGEHSTPKREDDGILLLSARNVQNGYLDLTKVDYIGNSEYERIAKRCHPEVGDILISCSGSIGRVCTVPKNLRFGLVRSVALIKPDSKKIHSDYLMYLLQSPIIQTQIFRIINKTAQPNLFLGHIKGLKAPLPPIEQQGEIASTLLRIESEVQNVENLIESSKSLQKSLINQVF